MYRKPFSYRQRSFDWIKEPGTVNIIALLAALISLLAAVISIYPEIHNYLRKTDSLQDEVRDIAEGKRKDLTINPNQKEIQPTEKIIVKPDKKDIIIETGPGIDIRINRDLDSWGNSIIRAVLTNYELGIYRIEQAPNALIVIESLREVLDNWKSDVPNAPPEIEVIGCADATPMRPNVIYSGDLGQIKNIPYCSPFDSISLGSMTLEPNVSKLTNNAIAFLRAYDVVQSLRSIPLFSDAQFRIGIAATKNTGGEYRLSMFRIRIPGVLEKEYNDLSFFGRMFLPFFN